MSLALADHTFSFRAPAELAERLKAAERTYVELAADARLAVHVSRELEIELQRRLRLTPTRRSSQGGMLRAVIEAFVTATEAASRDETLAEELRAFDADDRAGAAERAALLRGSAATRDV